jgi:MFS family permease
MSGMTMAQSTIAAELDAYEHAMWFTSSYLIAMSSFGPLAGRLAAIFSPRTIILFTSVFFVAGAMLSAAAQSLPVFLLGRVVTGLGGAGIFTTAMILVLELTSRRRRGLFVGLVNTGFTTGVSLGAVVFGELVPVTGWVSLCFYSIACLLYRNKSKLTKLVTRGFCSGSRLPSPLWRALVFTSVCLPRSGQRRAARMCRLLPS